MGTLEALKAIKNMQTSIFYTNDVATSLKISNSNASHTLQRLAKSNHVMRIKKGLSVLTDTIDPLIIQSYLVAPFPANISHQTAL